MRLERFPRKNLDVMKEAVVQAEEAGAKITKMLEKQEKKRSKQEKKRLAAVALASSENSSAPEGTEETSERSKMKKKQWPRRLSRRMEWKTHLSLFPNPRKRNSFSFFF